MAEIYTNFEFDSFELKPESFAKNLEDYSKKLETTAKEFKAFAKFIKSKKIKILSAKGYPYAGSFSVDDIDTGRLEKAGLVVDLNKDQDTPVSIPTFYLDEDLDKELKKLDLVDTEITSKGYPFTDIQEEEIEEQSSLLNLVELLKNTEDPDSIETLDEDFLPGTLVVDVKQVGDHQYSFNLTVADLNDDPINVKFKREEGIFEYKCGSCEELHTETIASVFRSLKTTSALLSNLIAMIKNPKELVVALEFIDHDLRLLQSLVAFDYALDDNEGVVKDDDEYDHDDESDSDSDDNEEEEEAADD